VAHPSIEAAAAAAKSSALPAVPAALSFKLGSDKITKYCANKLGIKVGETTSDGRFSLSEVECLGSCGTAPMFQINFDYHENLTPEKVDHILDALK